MQPCHRLFGGFSTILAIYSLLALKVLSEIVSLNDVEGTWRCGAVLPDGRRLQESLVINQSGSYVEYLTNQIAGEKLCATLAGTLCISNGWLFLTMTNDFLEDGKHTILPRFGGALKITPFGSGQLSLVSANGTNRNELFRDSTVLKPSQRPMIFEKAMKINLTTVKFDNLPLKVVLTMLQDESAKRDPDRKGIIIFLGPDAKQLADAEINLELRDATLAEALERIAGLVGLEIQPTDSELLLVRKKAK